LSGRDDYDVKEDYIVIILDFLDVTIMKKRGVLCLEVREFFGFFKMLEKG